MMSSKKSLFIFFSSFLIATLFVQFVAAQDFPTQVQSGLDVFAKSLTPILQFTLGGDASITGELLLVKLLIFILMLSVLFMAAQNVPGIGQNRFVVWIVSIIIAVLSTRYISTPALVNFIWLPSGVLGITLTSLIPFILFFFFIESFESSIIRKFGWITFGTIFLFLAITRWDTLNENGTNYGWIYVIVAAISLIMIFADKYYRHWKLKANMKDITDRKTRIEVARVQEDINELTRRLGAARDAETRNAIRTEIKEARDSMNRLLTSV